MLLLLQCSDVDVKGMCMCCLVEMCVVREMWLILTVHREITVHGLIAASCCREAEQAEGSTEAGRR